MTDKDQTAPAESTATPGQYRVLARKYRPATFAEMIGQDAMVRVLTNAVGSGRLAHAFMLTGVRGVGKTTTARVLARGFNCIGPDGDPDFGPTIEPCGQCEHCIGIAEDRHVDVLELDAASRTGVDDMRELIEGVRYRPTSARYKVYIIDEVHMLSKSAFNALLKTLEEPPEHVKFIFATTEIRKVPVTVLSRCQRFDLRRVEADVLATYFTGLAEKEGAAVEPAAVQLVARAADGSVRDGLSLLDQAISDASETVTEALVRDMLGLADRSQSFDIFEALVKGDAKTALDVLESQYSAGADPAQVIEDLLEVTHWLTRIKISADVADDVAVPEIERVRGKGLCEGIGMPGITRAWQMLLKGLGEVRTAPSPVQAAEMVLIRLAHAATLPTPEDALKMLRDSPAETTAGAIPSNRSGGETGGTTTAVSASAPSGGNGSGVQAALSVVAETEPEADTALATSVIQEDVSPSPSPVIFADLSEIAALAGEKRQATLQAFLVHNARLVTLTPGYLEINGGEFADELTLRRLKNFLEEETGTDWTVTGSEETGAPTIAQVREQDARDAIAAAREHPLVRAVLETFPGARVREVETITRPATED